MSVVLLHRLFSLVCPLLQMILSSSLIDISLGHEDAYAHQEEAGSLEFQWMREYGNTFRTRGAFGVCP